jgi:universal stress protein E
VENLTSILVAVDDPTCGIPVLNKAVRLARRFGAHVDLLVADPAHASQFAAHCVALRGDDVASCSVPGKGEPLHEMILARVSSHCPDLVIKAPSGTHPLRRWALGANDWQLSRECPVPVMLAGQKSWAGTVRFAAAVDVSDPDAVGFARSILHTAGFLSLGCRGHLDVLYSEREQKDETVRMERAVKLAQLVREFHVGSERLQLFNGTPEERLMPLIAARGYDVLVLGAMSHRSGFANPFDCLSSRLVDASDSDVVLIKPMLAAAAVARPPVGSRGEQRLYQREELV